MIIAQSINHNAGSAPLARTHPVQNSLRYPPVTGKAHAGLFEGLVWLRFVAIPSLRAMCLTSNHR